VATMTSAIGRRNSTKGFTLIEILVSVAILATGIVSILGAFNYCISALAASRDRLDATFFLKQKIAEIEQGGISAGIISDTSGGVSPFLWRVEDRPTARPADSKITEVVVTAWRQDGGRTYSLATYVRNDTRR